MPTIAGLAWAHPRVCGENNNLVTIPDSPTGSSPRVRGKRDPHPVSIKTPRLIPACAGKTILPWARPALPWAHPRVCGENPVSLNLIMGPVGSSPRVRGKHRRPSCLRKRTGLIPACAGKTFHVSNAVSLERAHPRVCGENGCFVDVGTRESGSSPRVRGKRRFAKRERNRRGLIPACAGKTR